MRNRRTSFSASLDGSLKDVELSGSVTPAVTLAEMNDPESGECAGLPDFDFDALYRGASPAAGVPGTPEPPWDLRGPKESVIGWQARGLIRGEVLDIGCGYGDNAIYLTRSGSRVTGLDISPTALITAEQRAAAAGVSVRFAVADATRLDGYADQFDTVVDSGTFHCLDDAAKHRYADAVHRATRPGAVLLISCFCDAQPAGARRPLPVAVSEQTLREVFAGRWDIVSLQTAAVHRPQHDGTDATMAYWLLHARRATAPSVAELPRPERAAQPGGGSAGIAPSQPPGGGGPGITPSPLTQS